VQPGLRPPLAERADTVNCHDVLGWRRLSRGRRLPRWGLRMAVARFGVEEFGCRPPALTHGRLSLGGQGVLERGGLYLLVNRTMASTCCANSRRTWGSAL
jgi:hypothetical protein